MRPGSERRWGERRSGGAWQRGPPPRPSLLKSPRPAVAMTPEDPQRRESRSLARLALALVLYKLLVLLIAVAAPYLLPGFFSESSWYGNFHWPPRREPGTLTTLETWDAQHYLYLAEEGYARRRMPIAFFPLYPWAIRALELLPGVDTLAAALLLSNGMSLSACLLLYRFLEERHPGLADGTLALLLAFPGALFFHFPYTESLFLFLALGVVFALDRESYVPAGLAALLLALTRPNGVLIGCVIAYHVFVRWRRGRGVGIPHLACLAAPALGLGIYMLFMQATTGDAFAGFEMQRAFHAGRSVENLVDLPLLLRNLVDARVLHGIDRSLLDRLSFLYVIATLVPLWRLDRTFFWYALPMALVGPLSGSFVSYTRFAAVLFPCHLVAAKLLAGEERRGFRYLTLASLLMVQTVLLARHANNWWAG